ncbi:hypothetical protein CEXT_632441 [Caerostris extrusa]|uniref:Ionotropic glutamate receptor C-terminal domain-containing protein n=1 Tax=Caerostris extrusa TaxID=172846 RepID=A0AAV4XGI1_CAEEX|nr:hypothetical protein CEXT_632441 [Caerostris extrusa]
MGTVVGQPSNIGNGSVRSRILLTAWLLFVLISLSYSVTLLSHLIQPAKVAPIRNFRELSELCSPEVIRLLSTDYEQIWWRHDAFSLRIGKHVMDLIAIFIADVSNKLTW